MIQYAFTFLVIAIIAALLGFGGVAAISMEAARLLCFVFVVLFVVAALAHGFRGKGGPTLPSV